MTKVLELYGFSTKDKTIVAWQEIAERQHCPYLRKKCIKSRKSEPGITIGTCTTLYGRESKGVIICPFRLLERRQIFVDCIHLLSLHEPGNELHVVPEIQIPGGNVDYFLVSARNGSVKDFVGIELQALDTTGSVWPERQKFLLEKGIEVSEKDKILINSGNSFGMNWKMTAKTILVQMHHKVQTFQEINKHLVLVIQDHFMDYIRKEFRFGHLNNALVGDSAHFHVYGLREEETGNLKLDLDARFSTDANGIAECLGMQTSHTVELEKITKTLESKISPSTLLNF